MGRYFVFEQSHKTAASIRAHWGVENALHWILDVAFREDECRVRMDNAAENFGIIRQIALNLHKQEKSAKNDWCCF